MFMPAMSIPAIVLVIVAVMLVPVMSMPAMSVVPVIDHCASHHCCWGRRHICNAGVLNAITHLCSGRVIGTEKHRNH